MRWRTFGTALCFLAFWQCALPAATPREELIKRMEGFRTALADGVKLMQNKKYDEAISKLRDADQLIPGQLVIHYNIACALSLSGKKNEALDTLEKAVKLGFTDHQHMQQDKDLESLRDADRFKELVALAKRRSETPAPLVHVPKGYDEKATRTYPLFVSLHGAGGTPAGLLEFEKDALGADKYFILAPYGSAVNGPGYTWNNTDLPKVITEIEQLKKKYRIAKVYLFGFSAGAHMGYVFLLKYPKTFDGFIPMAGSLRKDWVTDEELKNAKGLPVYAIQGAADDMVPLKAAEQTLDLLKKNGALTTMFRHSGGHTAPPDFAKVLSGAIDWIDQQKK